MAVGSDLIHYVITTVRNKGGDPGTFLDQPVSDLNKSYANYRNSNRHNPIRWRRMDYGQDL